MQVATNGRGADAVRALIQRVGLEAVRRSMSDVIAYTRRRIGKRIAELCGRDMRRVTLELGGKSAAIMLDDVDIEKAVPGIIGCSVAMLQGEICTAQSRIIVPRARYDEIVDDFAEQIAALPVGDPADRDIAIGPKITRRSMPVGSFDDRFGSRSSTRLPAM